MTSAEPEPTGAPATGELAHGEPGMSWTYRLGRTFVAPLARMVYRPIIEGREHVPRDGAVILASILGLLTSFCATEFTTEFCKFGIGSHLVHRAVRFELSPQVSVQRCNVNL